MPDNRNYYVFCEDNCRFDGMTKEQIISAISNATGVVPSGIDIDDAFVTKLKEMNANKQVKLWIGTSAEFNALPQKEENTLYILSDDDTEESLQAELAEIRGRLNASGVGALPVSGGTMAGNIAMGGYKITGTGTPTESTDAVNKAYVDDKFGGKTIVFWCGEGTGNDTTRASGYTWLDTGNTLNIKAIDYLLEVDFIGFGVVGSASAAVAKIVITFTDNTKYESIKCENKDSISGASSFKFQSKHHNVTFGTVARNEYRLLKGEAESVSVLCNTGMDYSPKTIKRVQVVADNNNANLMNCFVRFIKKNQ